MAGVVEYRERIERGYWADQTTLLFRAMVRRGGEGQWRGFETPWPWELDESVHPSSEDLRLAIRRHLLEDE